MKMVFTFEASNCGKSDSGELQREGHSQLSANHRQSVSHCNCPYRPLAVMGRHPVNHRLHLRPHGYWLQYLDSIT